MSGRTSGKPSKVTIATAIHRDLGRRGLEVVDTAEALFEVQDYEDFVAVQSEAALRNLASRLPTTAKITRSRFAATRGGVRALKHDIQERLRRPASRSSRRASAISPTRRRSRRRCCSARRRRRWSQRGPDRRGRGGDGRAGARALAKDKIVELDYDRRAAMVSNLLSSCAAIATPSRWSTRGRSINRPWSSRERARLLPATHRSRRARGDAQMGRRRAALGQRSDRVPAAPVAARCGTPAGRVSC